MSEVQHEYTSMGEPDFRKGRPEFFRQFPQIDIELETKHALIKPEQLIKFVDQYITDTEAKIQSQFLKQQATNPAQKLQPPKPLPDTVKAGIKQRIQEDYAYLEQELMGMFRDRDYRAKLEQNRYRRFQIYFMLLAAVATSVGATQVFVIDRPGYVAILAFIETLVALMTTYIATIRGNDSPLQRWLMHRRRAEALRREYFLFLSNVSPYSEFNPADRRRKLSERAADINRGVYPDDYLELQL